MTDTVNDCWSIKEFNKFNLPIDIIVNGFSIKKVIIDVLNNHVDCDEIFATDERLDAIAEEIKEAFSVKMGLKQGKDE